MIHKNNPDWSTHIPVLVGALLKIKTGPVLEMGMGIGSTPLLHAMCQDQGRELVSYEHDQKFVDDFRRFQTNSHSIIRVDNWSDTNIDECAWSIALVDHKPDERRHIDVERLRNNAVFVIIHDSQPQDDNIFQYSKIYHLFKYRFDYAKTKTFTTVLSNVYEFI